METLAHDNICMAMQYGNMVFGLLSHQLWHNGWTEAESKALPQESIHSTAAQCETCPLNSYTLNENRLWL